MVVEASFCVSLFMCHAFNDKHPQPGKPFRFLVRPRYETSAREKLAHFTCAPHDVKKTSEVESWLRRRNLTLGLGLNALIFLWYTCAFFRSQQPYSLHHPLPHRSSVCLVQRWLQSKVLVLWGSIRISSADRIERNSLEFVFLKPIFNANVNLQSTSISA